MGVNLVVPISLLEHQAG